MNSMIHGWRKSAKFRIPRESCPSDFSTKNKCINIKYNEEVNEDANSGETHPEVQREAVSLG
ncbi:hypothetical protein D3C76_1764890 [compost metagenome]